MNKELEAAKKEALAKMSAQEAAKLRKEEALAEAAENKNIITKIELAKAKEEVCLVEDAEFALRNLTATINQRLHQIPAKHGGDLVSISNVGEGRVYLRKLMDELIAEFQTTTFQSLMKRQLDDKERAEGINKRAKKEKTAMGQKGIRKQKVKK